MILLRNMFVVTIYLLYRNNKLIAYYRYVFHKGKMYYNISTSFRLIWNVTDYF